MEVSIEHKNELYTILIDDEDYDKIKDLNLIILTESYHYKKRVMDSKTRLSLHRFIIDSNPNQFCIHKNNNRFDFRKENLFITTRTELNELVKTGKIKQKFDELNRVYYEF